jgi:hypothetical protein
MLKLYAFLGRFFLPAAKPLLIVALSMCEQKFATWSAWTTAYLNQNHSGRRLTLRLEKLIDHLEVSSVMVGTDEQGAELTNDVNLALKEIQAQKWKEAT